MSNKKYNPSGDRPRTFTGKATKVVLIKGADKSILGPESIVTDKESELAWNKKKKS